MDHLTQFKHKILLAGIFLMSCVDAVFTLMWIEMSVGEEINPILAQCLEWGSLYFVIAKILLTSLGCLVLYVSKKKILSQRATFSLFCFYFLLILYHCVGSTIILID
jgi:hypothetical protein